MGKRIFLPAVFLALALPEIAAACAVCLTGAASGDPTTDAFNWSVIFLMAMPYTVVGSIAGWLFFAHWRASRRQGRKKESAFLRLAWTQKESGR